MSHECRVTKFSGVHCLDLHIPANFGADATVIDFIGFKGDFSKVSYLAMCLGLAVHALASYGTDLLLHSL